MKLSKKPRHWIALAIALATLILAVVRFLDFSGDPEPKWREVSTMIGTGVMMGFIVANFILDRQEDERKWCAVGLNHGEFAVSLPG